MSKRRPDEHGIEGEPFMNPARPPAGSGDHGVEAEPQFSDAARPPAPGGESYRHSVSDEPALEWAAIDRTAHPRYAEYVRRRHHETPVWRKLLATVLAIAVAGPLAVAGVFFGGPGFGIGVLGLVLVGPIVEEVLKVAFVLYLVERRPWLLPGRWAIILIGTAAGLAFGAIENLLYIYVYFPGSPELAAFRWAVTMPLHAAWSTVAAVGVSRCWGRIVRGESADVGGAMPWLVTAVVLHGGYNFAALMLEWTGVFSLD